MRERILINRCPMNLFKAKTADELEDKLMKIVNGFSNKLGLKEEVTTKVKNAEGHIKVGLVGGLGIGALGMAGGIASIAVAPAIATTAVVAGFTAAGVTILGGGALMMAGLSYAGIGKLYTKYQESRLGNLDSQIFEGHRLKMEDIDFESKFSQKFHDQTDSKLYSKGIDVYSIMQAVKHGDMDQAKNLVKSMVAQVGLPEGKPKAALFKEPVADSLQNKLGNFFDEYKNKMLGIDNQNKIMKADSKMGVGMLVAMGAAMGSAAGIVALSSPAIIGGSLAFSAAALGYSAIQKMIKTGLEQRNEVGFEIDANRHIHKVANDLNINADDLRSIQTIMKNKTSDNSELKEKFVNETSARIKNKVS